MKGAIAFVLIMFQASAFAETQDVDKETLKEIYEFCFTLQNPEDVKEKKLLVCINEELEYSDYNKFKSVKEVQEAIKDN